MAAEPSVRVLYLAGAGRSGSTILDRILGQLDGFFSVGELVNIWERGLVEGRRCGCGLPVAGCPTWTGILAHGFGGGRELEPARLAALKRRQVRARRVPSLALAGWRRPDEYREALGSLYEAVRGATGCRVIVDSSKSPVYARLLADVPGVELTVLHLVRDPRATAWSWLRHKRLPDFGDERWMQRQRPLKAAALWSLWNLVTEAFWRGAPGGYLRLRYEDFVADPERAVRAAAALVGPVPATPFVSGTAVRLGPTHSVSGNPNRFDTGVVELRADGEWLGALRPRDRAVVTALTWPLLLRYRYPLRPRPAPERRAALR